MLNLLNHNIILPKYLEIVKKKGSSFIFSAQGGRGKENNYKPAAKNFASPSEGAAEGGLVFALPPAEPIGRKISSDFNQKVPHRNIKPARWVFYFCAVYSEYSSNEFSSSPACGGLGAGSAASPHSLTISSFSFGYF